MMDIIKRKEECYGCYACYNICPMNAIQMERDEQGFVYPKINKKKCIDCNQCREVCPSLNSVKHNDKVEVYGCYALNLHERLASSSGGIFSVIAKKILKDNGIVCGAAYDDNQLVSHICVKDEEGLEKIRGSKYVQSNIGEIYKKIKEYLESEKKVLFSGTSCQVAGLKRYLKKEYTNLYCIDLICHGVPSPTVWKRYLKALEGETHIEKVIFRNKEKGISNSTIDYYLDNGEIIKEDYANSLYMKGFINNFYIRPSCTECKFKGKNRYSDITIGDFWSIKEYYPDFSDDFGTSAILVHSKKGKEIIQSVQQEINIIKSSMDRISVWNECVYKSTEYNSKQEKFFETWDKENIFDLIEELNNEMIKEKEETNNKFISKIYRRVRCIIQNKNLK